MNSFHTDTPGFIIGLIVVLSLILILFLIYIREIIQILRLYYILLLKGKFSYEFVDFFKKKNLRNPLNTCIRDEITMHFLPFFKEIKDAQHFATGTLIEFEDVPFGSTYKKLKKIKGAKPDCINIDKFKDSKVFVVGYNDIVDKLKMKSLFYFIDGFFIMGEYLFTEINPKIPSEILSTLASKYLKNSSVNSDAIYIKDQPGNGLIYEHDGFNISVKYFFHGNSKINHLLYSVYQADYKANQNSRADLENKELFKRL